VSLADAPYRPLTRQDRVSNEPLRERLVFLLAHDRVTLGEVAEGMGWVRSVRERRPDTSRVQRTLGLRPDQDRNGRQYYRQTVDHATAERFARVLDIDPIDAGF
jgi:hypothetical protein